MFGIMRYTAPNVSKHVLKVYIYRSQETGYDIYFCPAHQSISFASDIKDAPKELIMAYHHRDKLLPLKDCYEP